MNEQKVSVKEALKVTIGLLEKVQVPVSLLEEIGFPVKQAVNNLKRCIAVIPDLPDDEPNEEEPIVEEVTEEN